MKHLIVLASIVSIAIAQRPTYAGLSSKGYPELASRFRDPDADQDQNNTNTVGIGSRLGADEEPPQNLPTDARGDSILVNRLNQWPRENRPFWLLNAQHLDQHRRPNDNVNQPQQNVINTDQPANLGENQQEINRDQPTLGGNQQTITSGQTNREQLQSRFGEPVGTDVRTIRPISQRGSFAGQRL